MPSVCGVFGCANKRSKFPWKSFFRLPSVDMRFGGAYEDISQERRERWLANICRSDISEVGKKYLIVCSDHFLTGRPAPLYATTDPDWAPTVKLGYNNDVTQGSVAISNDHRQQRQEQTGKRRRKQLAVQPCSTRGSVAVSNDHQQRQEQKGKRRRKQLAVQPCSTQGSVAVSNDHHQRRQEKKDKRKKKKLAAQPCRNPVLHDSSPSSVLYDRSCSGYANCLPEDQRTEYHAKLQMKDPRIDLPDPYKLAKWTNDMKKWPDLRSIHVHRYLLSRQKPMTESEETECASLQGYNAFKLGDVQEVQYATASRFSLVCFLKAVVVLHPKAGIDACQAWVCLEKATGNIKTSHCICLRDFAGVCGHIAGLLFKVEAGVALAKNKEESHRDTNNASNGVLNKGASSRLCTARVKDTFFTRKPNNKRLRQPLKNCNLKPLSKAEEKEALAKLKEILPNAAVFAKDDSDTDSATESEEDGKEDEEELSPSQHNPQTAPADVADSAPVPVVDPSPADMVDIATGSEGDGDELSPSQHYPQTASEDVVDLATGNEGDREDLSPSQCHPHTAPADVVDDQPSSLPYIHSQTASGAQEGDNESMAITLSVWSEDPPERRQGQQIVLVERPLRGESSIMEAEKARDAVAFHEAYGMTPATFDELLRLIGPHIARQSTTFGEPVGVAERLGMTLSYLATGTAQKEVAKYFCVARSSVCSIIPQVCQAIWDVVGPLVLPKLTPEDWKRTAEEFNIKWNFPHCLGAIDGKHIWALKPVLSGSQYCIYNRNPRVVVMLAIADAACRLLYLDVGPYGEEQDGSVFSQSEFRRALENGTLLLPQPEVESLPYVFVANEAVPLNPQLMRPYSGSDLTEKKAIFNHRLSCARKVVDNAFGIMVTKWCILRHPIIAKPDKIEIIVKAIGVLYNFLHDKECKNVDLDMSLEASSLDGVKDSSGAITYDAASENTRESFADFFISPEGSLPGSSISS